MSADLVIATLASGGQPATKLANVIQQLVIEAGKLGELEVANYVRSTNQLLTDEDVDAMAPEQLAVVRDHLVKVKRFPAIWLVRLSDGIDRGLFWNYSDERIVQIMRWGRDSKT
ncbi:hypothetical protein [Bradyrhizobium tunisiense]|uniref:hypothetical protein n=1 Tax=Bradyrhizobium tunisiense TaxID=3278709 RepID=UPI0035DFD32D